MTDTSSPAARAASAFGRAASSAGKGTRAAIRRNPTANTVYRTGVGVVGGTTVALGIVLIPLPGPGSLIAVGGLALLGTEFAAAQKANLKAQALGRAAVAKAKDARARRAAKRATGAAGAHNATDDASASSAPAPATASA